MADPGVSDLQSKAQAARDWQRHRSRIIAACVRRQRAREADIIIKRLREMTVYDELPAERVSPAHLKAFLDKMDALKHRAL